MAKLFISDLHLSAQRPAITDLFLDFLQRRAARARALYILGDLFEYWIGDEAAAQPEFLPVIQALRRLTADTLVYVMHGNRDFLLGDGFIQATGCRLLTDPTRIDLYGTPTLITHGDTLCTADTEYMAIREVVRSPKWQRDFLAKTIPERERLVRNYREMSKASTAEKEAEIMDVTPAAVETTMRSHGVFHLIHGHTHRPGRHSFELDGKPALRFVLGDWYEHGSVLRCDPDGWVLEALPVTERKQQKSL